MSIAEGAFEREFEDKERFAVPAAERDLATDKLRAGDWSLKAEKEIAELKRRLDEIQRDRDSLKQRNTFLETDNKKLANDVWEAGEATIKRTSELDAARAERDKLADAIKTHRSQKADDRCIEDDDRLYEALGDGIKCDRRVGDRNEMLKNCARFIQCRTEGGGPWVSYAALEAENADLEKQLEVTGTDLGDTAKELNDARVTIDRQKGQIAQLEAMVYGDMPAGPRLGPERPIPEDAVKDGLVTVGSPSVREANFKDAFPTVLEEAAATVEDRMKRYGSPAPMFQMLADLWTSYLEPRIKSALTGRDAALMCALLKIAREGSGGPHHDNIVDIAGYARCAELASKP